MIDNPAFCEIQVGDIVNRSPVKWNGQAVLVASRPGEDIPLTQKPFRALWQADVLLRNDLVSDEGLELARRVAKRLLVGMLGSLWANRTIS